MQFGGIFGVNNCLRIRSYRLAGIKQINKRFHRFGGLRIRKPGAIIGMKRYALRIVSVLTGWCQSRAWLESASNYQGLGERNNERNSVE